MKMKKVTALVLAVSMIASLSACGGTDTTGKAESTDSTETADNSEFITLDFFDTPGNYQGVQPGWFGKIIKDKFNLEVNIISPNVAGGGETLYQTRSASGNLGDIISVSKEQLRDCVESGIIMDISDYYENCENLKKYDVAVQGLKEYLDTDKVYGIPSRTSLRSPEDPETAGTQPSWANFMRVDLYKEIGAPVLENQDDVLQALKQMQDLHPTTEDGSKVYAISMFKDWDGVYMNFPNMMTRLYGYNIDGDSFVFMNSDVSDIQTVIDDDGVYYKELKFLFEANQMGLVDPDSSSQNWDMVVEKTRNGQVLWEMWPWASIDHYNTEERTAEGKGFQAIPVMDQVLYSDSYNQYGNHGCVLAIGANCKNVDRAIEFLDWMGSTEYMELTNSGPEGLTWEMVDGKAVITEFGKQAKSDPDNTTVPEEYGGGNYNSGCYLFNEGVGLAEDIDPRTNETYAMTGWSSINEDNKTKLQEDWTELFGAETPVDYFLENDMMSIAPGTNYSRPTDSSAIAAERAQCGEAIKNASWSMVFASSEEEFNSIWEKLKADLPGYGYEEVLEVDYANAQLLKEAREAALAE
ncbi:extracellular solute-binding protein [Robinsoniella peoriensis]|uniref:extracellular solute-binding protein n=1 Tax=Robinsoniella peoriensis TaxID=180332 RepID=UPI00085BBC4D|nr:extracellular solute-binding protein [Robinsoniella peoriensis]